MQKQNNKKTFSLNWEEFGVYPFSMGYADFSFFDVADDASTSFRLLTFKRAYSSRNATNIHRNRFRLSVSVLTLAALRIPWGFVIDKLGVKLSTGLALTLLGLFGLLRGFAINYESLLVYQFFMGVGFAAVMPCLPKLAALLFPREKTSFPIGVSISGFAVGDVIAPIGTPQLLKLLDGWRNVFQVYGAWALIFTALWWVFSRKLGEAYGSKQPSQVHSDTLGKDIAALFRNRQVWLLSGLYFSAGACYDTLFVWLPSILGERTASNSVEFNNFIVAVGLFRRILRYWGAF